MIYKPSCLNVIYAVIYYMCISSLGFSIDLDVRLDSVKESLRSGSTFKEFTMGMLPWVI